MESNNLQEYISATRIRLRKTSPFFAALSLYAEIEFTTKVQLAATNGKKIFLGMVETVDAKKCQLIAEKIEIKNPTN